MTGRRIDTLVVPVLDDAEIGAAKNVYVGADEQPPTYDSGLPDYARLVADLIASMRPSTVLEFGANAGRNLDLIRQRHPVCDFRGVDVNALNVERGRARFGFDLLVADETWLATQAADSVDVAFTVSVIDHMPYPEQALRHLLRISAHYLVLFELAHDRLGRAAHNLVHDAGAAALSPVYRYSYIHDYRYECERKLGALCLADLRVPIGPGNLLDLYRLYVFSKRHDLYAQSLVTGLQMRPIAAEH